MRKLFVLFATASSLAAAAVANAATIDCTSSPYVVDASTGNVTLPANTTIRSNNGGVCVELRDGRDLNLNGGTIECIGTCSWGVRATSAGSVIQNGNVTGFFLTGSIGVEEVKDINFDGQYYGLISGTMDEESQEM